jgi:antitoxin (DNA-binding transcriptional repressor) of toxin-antitoxin stability system
MRSFITLAEAQARLPELIAQLIPGEELQITQDEETVAKLIKVATQPLQPRQPGSACGELVIVEEDDAHLEDFEEYMP